VTGSILNRVKQWLAEPTTAGRDLDDAETTTRHRALIRSKPFLRQIYLEWYCLLDHSLPDVSGPILELGSGGGFLADVQRRVITSDILAIPNVDVRLDAGRLPFGDAQLRAIVMTNVFHHLPDVARFLGEAVRCLKPNGAIVMIEPWVTPWSRWVFTRFHHEPFDPNAPSWSVAAGHPLSSANGALPWLVFSRDRGLLHDRFPQLQVTVTEPLMPLRYVVSGGVSVRALVPGWAFPLCRWLDTWLVRVTPAAAMFARIVVERRAERS
jgi:SAM-dependent methyltransferase